MNRTLGLCAIRILLVIEAALLLPACGSDSSSGAASPTTNTYVGTQSPGDLWTATFQEGSFTATNSALSPSLTFSGTTAALPSGFLKLTVTASSDTALVPLGSVGYAFEFPGTATFLKPPGASSDTKAVFLVARSASSGFAVGSSFNWVTIPSAIWDSTTSNAYGNGTVTNIASGTITLNIDEFMLDGTQTTNGVDNSLSDQGQGQMTGTDANSNVLTFQVSPSGAFMGDVSPPTPTDLEVAGFVGMKAPAVSVDTASLLTVGRQFRGVLFRNASSPFTETIWGEIQAGPSFVGGNFTDVEAGTTAQNITINLGSQTSPGIFVGTIDDPDPDLESAVFMVNQVGGKYFIFGIGAYTSTQPFNFMLMEN